MSSDQHSLQPGALLVSSKRNYKVVSELGAGGFGITYLAKGQVKVDNVTVEALFAIKELYPRNYVRRVANAVVPDPEHAAEFAKFKNDFILEVTQLQRLGSRHDNIVKVNEIFETNGTAYYVMQHIKGESLYDYVTKYGPLDPGFAVNLMMPVLSAVEFLHHNRINHFDIKPDNIMLEAVDDGIMPVLIDFGLSLHFNDEGRRTTPRGMLGVSSGYAPIEQYGIIDKFSPQSDVYSLAATLSFMLTGNPPAAAPNIDIADHAAKLADRAPAHVVKAICRAMGKLDNCRTQSVEKFRAELTGEVSVDSAPDGNHATGDATDPARITAHPFAPAMATVPASAPPAVNPNPQAFAGKPDRPSLNTPDPPVWGNTKPPLNGRSNPNLVGTTPFNGPEGYNPVFPGAAGAPGNFNNVPSRSSVTSRKSSNWILWVIIGVVVVAAAVCIPLFILDTSDEETAGQIEAVEESVSTSTTDETPTTESTSTDQATTDAADAAATDTPDAVSASPSSSQSTAPSASQSAYPGKTPADHSKVDNPTPAKPQVTNGTVSVRNGVYSGQMRNGKPHGKGKITFRSEGPADPSVSVMAYPGYYMTGYWNDGQLETGYLYDESGNKISTIIP